MTGPLNGERGRLRLGGVGVEVYHWAEMAGTVVNPPHRHTYHEVCWVEGGTGSFVVDGRRHALEPGALLFARPGVRHQIISERAPGIRLAWVAFRLSLPAEPGDDLDGLFAAFAAGPPLAHDGDGRVGALWSALRQVAAGPALPGQTHAAGALAQALLIALAQAGADGLAPLPVVAADAGAGLVRRALRYVQDNVDRPVPVEELARHVHLSTRQLTRLFGSHVGRSPAAYIEQVRLDHAVALLLRTAMPVKQVAAELGYPDAAQFTRAFTRRYGVPPARFRREAELGPALAGIAKPAAG